MNNFGGGYNLFLDPTLDFQAPWTIGKDVMIKMSLDRTKVMFVEEVWKKKLLQIE